jgi:hypothetical protein
MPTDSPRVIIKTRSESKTWKWWPGTESNHRHADFQYGGARPGSLVSRRKGGRAAAPTEPPPPTEPMPSALGGRPTEPRRGPTRFMGLRPSRPSGDRASAAELLASLLRYGILDAPGSCSPSDMGHRFGHRTRTGIVLRCRDDSPGIMCTSHQPSRPPAFGRTVTARPLGVFMARPPNYSQDKKRREEAARKKREEKQQRRQPKKDVPVAPTH